jgi:hypothetical protein
MLTETARIPTERLESFEGMSQEILGLRYGYKAGDGVFL